MNAVKKVMVGESFDLVLGYQKMRDFKKSLTEGCAAMEPLETAGTFRFNGCLVSVLFSGEGYIFQAGDAGFMISHKDVPSEPGIEEGSWVEFVVDGLEFGEEFPLESAIVERLISAS
jgi:hypothetical protein